MDRYIQHQEQHLKNATIIPSKLGEVNSLVDDYHDLVGSWESCRLYKSPLANSTFRESMISVNHDHHEFVAQSGNIEASTTPESLLISDSSEIHDVESLQGLPCRPKTKKPFCVITDCERLSRSTKLKATQDEELLPIPDEILEIGHGDVLFEAASQQTIESLNVKVGVETKWTSGVVGRSWHMDKYYSTGTNVGGFDENCVQIGAWKVEEEIDYQEELDI